MSSVLSDSVLHTLNVESVRQVPQMKAAIEFYQANLHPYTRLTMQMKKFPIKGYKVIWFDDEQLPDKTLAASNQNDTDVEVTVTTGQEVYGIVNDLVMDTTSGEIMRISDVDTSTHKWTIERGVGGTLGGTAAANISIGHELLILGCSFDENSLSPTPRLTEPTERYNLVEIMKESLAESEDSAGTELYQETNRARQRLIKRQRMVLRLEKSALFGQKSQRRHPVSNMPWRTADGLDVTIKTNRHNLSGAALTEALLEEACLYAFDESVDGQMYVLASNFALSRINSWGASRLQVLPEAGTYGVSIKRYVNAHGTLNLINHRMLRGNVLSKRMYLLDLNYCWYVPRAGWELQLQADIQENDRDGWKDQWIHKGTWMVEKERAHHVIENFT